MVVYILFAAVLVYAIVAIARARIQLRGMTREQRAETKRRGREFMRTWQYWAMLLSVVTAGVTISQAQWPAAIAATILALVFVPLAIKAKAQL